MPISRPESQDGTTDLGARRCVPEKVRVTQVARVLSHTGALLAVVYRGRLRLGHRMDVVPAASGKQPAASGPGRKRNSYPGHLGQRLQTSA